MRLSATTGPTGSSAGGHVRAVGRGRRRGRTDGARARCADEHTARSIPSIEQRVDAFMEQLEARRKEQERRSVRRSWWCRATGSCASPGSVSAAGSAEPVTDETRVRRGLGHQAVHRHGGRAHGQRRQDGLRGSSAQIRAVRSGCRTRRPMRKLNMIDLLAHRSGLDRSDCDLADGTLHARRDVRARLPFNAGRQAARAVPLQQRDVRAGGYRGGACPADDLRKRFSTSGC